MEQQDIGHQALKKKPKVSIILTAHNYAKYLSQSINSALNQTFQNFELIIVNDGSTDYTNDVLVNYSDHPQVVIINLDGVGLAGACNAGIRSSHGEYIIRLDADDFFDENILLVQSNYLDHHPEVHLVYSDYFRIDSSGALIDYYRLMKSNDELKLLDRAPLGAGAMFRKWCIDQIGGYNQELRYQEDYDFWLKFVKKFNVYNIRLPLMYYRKHDISMSTNSENRLMARRYVKHDFVKKHMEPPQNIIGVVPASEFIKHNSENRLVLKMINGHPLIYYPIKALTDNEYISDVYIITDDPEIEKIAQRYGAKSLGLKPKELSKPSVTTEEVVRYHIQEMDKHDILMPNFVATLSPLYPFIRPCHLTEAIDTLMINDYDSVISVIENYAFYWSPGAYGLEPCGYNRKKMKEDRDSLYLETGGIRVVKSKNLLGANWLGSSVGMIELTSKDIVCLENNDISQQVVSMLMEKYSTEKISEENYLRIDSRGDDVKFSSIN